MDEYVSAWERRGYADGIPDEVPRLLMNERLAPSYRAICVAILKNDASLQSLGFTPKRSRWYDALKRVELEAIGKQNHKRHNDLRQLRFAFADTYQRSGIKPPWPGLDE